MKSRRILEAAVAGVFWLAVWHIASAAVGLELTLPSPISVARALIRLASSGGFWLSAVESLGRITAGLLAGVLAGTLAAALMAVSRISRVLLSPILRIVRSTPVASFIILALLWIGRGRVPGFISALMVAPVVASSLYEAVREIDPRLLELARAYRFGGLRTLKLVVVPSVIPAFRASCVVSVGLAWKSGVAAEVLCLPERAVGSELYYSKIYLETPELFAWTAVVILLSFIVEAAVKGLLVGGRDEARN